MIDYEKSLLVVAETLREDLVQKGLNTVDLNAIDSDIASRRKRITKLENVDMEPQGGNYIFLPYTDEEKALLKDDGALVYLLEGQSIGSQRKGGRRFWSNWHEGQPIEDLSSRLYEVAIYPNDFFVPRTFNKSKAKQEELVIAHGQALQARLGIENLAEILPAAPEATEVMFKHFDLTGVRLLGENYMTRDGYWSYIITNTPANESGSSVACVGFFFAVLGSYVRHWRARRGDPALAAARWVVKLLRT